MKLNVKVTKSGKTDGRPWMRTELEEKEITHIRAFYIHGNGSATIQYEGKDNEGNWYQFFKKDNKNVKLPVIDKYNENWTQVLIDVKGIRGIYKYQSEEIRIG